MGLGSAHHKLTVAMAIRKARVRLGSVDKRGGGVCHVGEDLRVTKGKGFGGSQKTGRCKEIRTWEMNRKDIEMEVIRPINVRAKE